LSENITREKLAAVAGCGIAHLNRRFRNALGMSPHRYLLELRLSRARFLVESSSMPLAHIALECGFCHQEHMTRYFGRRWGAPPGAFRRQHAQAKTSV